MTAKQQTTALLEKLPDECSIEDIQYHLYVVSKVEKGIEQLDKGQSLTHHQAKAKLSKWLTK